MLRVPLMAALKTHLTPRGFPSALVGLWLALAPELALGTGFRLPRAVRPLHYNLSLLYDLDPNTNFSFFANVDILLIPEESTKKIVLHANGIHFNSSHVKLYRFGNSLITTGVQINPSNEFLTVSTGEALEKDVNYRLSIPFYGNLEDGLDGAYISSYRKDVTSPTEYLIATQFQAISARKAFPCFDEPHFKATFGINIGHHQNFTAISNMPVKSQSKLNALENIWPWTTVEQTFKKKKAQFVWDQFEVSLPMSTYLLAWVVSDFDSVEGPGGANQSSIRIWARADAKNQLKYASEISQELLKFYVDWFVVPFPLPKQDMVAIPDFAEGAMENWGLITYREANLLHQEGETSLLFNENIVATIGHELAHQWFGNLVTMKWWSDLWLNEGFATYMGTLGMASVEPSWDAEEGHTVTTMMDVLQVDMLDLSHAVHVNIENPYNIGEIFDAISYEKGSLLVRMMLKFMGKEAFKEGITNYLQKYSYKNADQNDLLNELTLAKLHHGGFPRVVTVKTIMDTWTTQAGYPLLTIKRNYDENKLEIKQKRYVSTISTATEKPSWWVPLQVLSQGKVGKEPNALLWLAADEGVDNGYEYGLTPGSDEWVLFNADMIAPCRVNYDERNWVMLTQALHSAEYYKIPVLSRVQLLSDVFSLASMHVLDYKLALNMATYLKQETDYFPIEAGLASLADIDSILKRTSDYGPFREYVRKIILPIYKRVGGLGDDITKANMKTLKTKVLLSNWACRMELLECQEEAIMLFREWMNVKNPDTENPIPLDMRSTVYCQAISRGSVKEWDFLLARWRNTKVASVAEAIVPALACTRQVWLLSKYLAWAVTPGSVVRSQDAVQVLVTVTSSRVGYYVARSFIYSNIAAIHHTFRGQEKYLGPVMQVLVDQFTTDRELDEFLSWSNANSKYLTEIILAINQAVEGAQINVKWVQDFQSYVVNITKNIC